MRFSGLSVLKDNLDAFGTRYLFFSRHIFDDTINLPTPK